VSQRLSLAEDSALRQAVDAAAAHGCDVVLTLANSGFLDTLENFLVQSVRLGLKNVVVIGLSAGVCDSGRLHGAPCVPYSRSFGTADYGTAAFVMLTNAKTEAALTVALMGYNVLLVDLDVFLFQDPLPTLRQGAASADVQIQVRASGCTVRVSARAHMCSRGGGPDLTVSALVRPWLSE
jgi:hypothetical protein